MLAPMAGAVSALASAQALLLLVLLLGVVASAWVAAVSNSRCRILPQGQFLSAPAPLQQLLRGLVEREGLAEVKVAT